MKTNLLKWEFLSLFAILLQLYKKLQNVWFRDKHICESYLGGFYSITTGRSVFLESGTLTGVQSVYERLASYVAGFDVFLNWLLSHTES